jgi:hypothetical protein
MNNQPLITALRYLVSALGAIVAALVALGYMAQSDAEKIGKLLEQLSEHGGVLVGVLGALASAAATAYGAYKASNAAHVARIEQTPGLALVVTNADTAPAAAVAAADDPNRHKVELSPDARRDNEHA